jgi:hypothetical protein
MRDLRLGPANARLIGIECIVTERLFRQLPEDEKRLMPTVVPGTNAWESGHVLQTELRVRQLQNAR